MTAKRVTVRDILENAGVWYEAALIDMDGTILNSLHMWEDVDRSFLGRRGLPVERDYLEALKTMTFPECADYTIRRYGLKETPEAVMAEWNQLAAEAYSHSVTLMPGAEDFLKGLKERRIPMALCSVSQKHMVDAAMEGHGLIGYFALLADASCSEKGKSDPGLFHYAAGKLEKQPSRCLVVEDSLQAMRTASLAGYRVLAMIGPDSENTGTNGKDFAEIEKWADYYLPTFLE